MSQGTNLQQELINFGLLGIPSVLGVSNWITLHVELNVFSLFSSCLPASGALLVHEPHEGGRAWLGFPRKTAGWTGTGNQQLLTFFTAACMCQEFAVLPRSPEVLQGPLLLCWKEVIFYGNSHVGCVWEREGLQKKGETEEVQHLVNGTNSIRDRVSVNFKMQMLEKQRLWLLKWSLFAVGTVVQDMPEAC